MNTRLQVEHPVTELITGLDLVELQILVANNHKLPFKQSDLTIKGHAIEARVYAEDINNNFLPATGRIDYLEFYQDQYIRVDHGIKEGDEISIYYDPMVAKIISYGSNRLEATNNLLHALKNSYLLGVKNNIGFIINCLTTNDFQSANISTKFIENNCNNLIDSHKVRQAPVEAWLAAAIYYNFYNKSSSNQQVNYNIFDPWQANNNYRLNQDNIYNLDLSCINVDTGLSCDNKKRLSIQSSRDGFIKTENIEELVVTHENISYVCKKIIYDNKSICFSVEADVNQFSGRIEIKALYIKKQLNIYVNANHYIFVDNLHDNTEHSLHGHHGSLTAPMHGTVVAVNVSAGEKVNQGDTLIILEAMKMEHVITAPMEGIVTVINFSQGQQVNEGAELLIME